MTATPDAIESAVIVWVRWIKLGVEVFGAGLVTVGVCLAIVHLLRTLAARVPADFTATRLILARHLALALEFELGADILGTAVSPTWDQIGKLGAVAVIRTGLNFFLSMEMRGEKPLETDKKVSAARSPPDSAAQVDKNPPKISRAAIAAKNDDSLLPGRDGKAPNVKNQSEAGDL